MQAEIAGRLEEIIKYLRPYLPLANCHMVNFLTEQLWQVHAPEIMQNEVSFVGGTDLNNIFFHYAKYSLQDEVSADVRTLMENFPHFSNFLKNARSMSLRGIGQQKLIASYDELKEKLVSLGWEVPEDVCMEQFMTYKKMHEVEVMSQVVAALVYVTKATHVVDVGGGKGYLSSFLSLYHGLRVLGVDSSQINTRGAVERTKKLEKVWRGLCRRADFLKQGSMPPRRGKHWKSHDDEENQTKLNEQKEVLYKQVTEFVTPNTDLSKIVKQQFETDECDRLGIVGLHTCGDLAPSCLRIFRDRPEFASLCNVGCCYHLMEEKHCRSPFWNDVDPLHPELHCGFPMSQFLNDKKFFLGRNARMLAAQSLDRMGEQQEAQTESLFFRALLQVLLLEKCGENVPWGQVGRLTGKSLNFVDYVQKALRRLKLDISVDSDEIEALYSNYIHEQEKLHVFFLLRVSLAPVIEAVILLDRLLYLHEQGIHESYLIRLFDPVISPRCYCIVAFNNATS